MDEHLDRAFGIVIAYVLPGVLALWSLGFISAGLASLLIMPTETEPSFARFMYVALASLGAGMIVSAIRWALIDSIHHHTGVPMSDADFSKLQDKLAAYAMAVEHYYRYYQFYANSLVAGFCLAVCSVIAGNVPNWPIALTFAVVFGILWAASRDSLRRYYTRVEQLLGTRVRAS